jgi:hypothetical protein
MYSRTSQENDITLGAAQKDASRARRCPEAAFCLDLRPVFPWAQLEAPRKEAHNRRRSLGMDKGEKRILGGSDPTESGFSAAHRLRRRGSLPPNFFTRLVGSVAGDPAKKTVTEFEYNALIPKVEPKQEEGRVRALGRGPLAENGRTVNISRQSFMGSPKPYNKGNCSSSSNRNPTSALPTNRPPNHPRCFQDCRHPDNHRKIRRPRPDCRLGPKS